MSTLSTRILRAVDEPAGHGALVPTECVRLDDSTTPVSAVVAALRFDAGTLGKVERTPTGGVRVPAHVTRVGVLTYVRRDGTTVREYRPADEVFHADSLATLADAAVTVAHPPAGKVTPETFRTDAVGYVREPGRADGHLVRAQLVLQDAAAIARVDAGELVELSCGYACVIDPTPGVTPDGERYDQVQRAIRYNHVALLPRGGGRAGPDVRLRLDGACVEVVERTLTSGAPPAEHRNDTMKTERIDGVDYEIGSVAWAQARERRDARIAENIAALEAGKKAAEVKAAEQSARADASEARVRSLEQELSPARLDARVAERAALLEKVRPVLGAEKLDGKSDIEVMTLALAKLSPDFKADAIDASQRDVYVRARFDAEIRHAKTPLDRARADAAPSSVSAPATTAPKTADYLGFPPDLGTKCRRG